MTVSYSLSDNAFMLKDAIITVRIPSAVKEALLAAAAEDNRSPANLVTIILTKSLQESGHLKASKKPSAGRK